jgi:23S rRNA (pseudouridine1915-N3)-methyltransferase
MKITILCVGKLKEKYLVEACQEYAKRLGKYCKLNIVELNEVKLIKDTPSYVQQVINEESASLLEHLNPSDYNILLSLRGQEYDSIAFSKMLNNKMNEGHSSFCFIIGGSYGTNPELENKVNSSWCLSSLTFPHQITRLLILEQIYRSFKILNNEVYHK